MKVLVFIFLLVNINFARQLITTDEIETLFKKFINKELTDEETRTLDDVFEILYRNEHASENFIEHNSNSRLTLDCIICRSAIAALFDGIQNGQTDEELSETVTTLCTYLGVESYTVCSGAISLNIPIFTYIIKNTPEATPAAFCGLVMQTASDPNVCPFNDPRFEWEIDIPDSSVVEETPDIDTSPYNVVIITDAHLDPLYEAYGVANCGEPTCCRKGQTPSNSYIYKSNFNESMIEESIVNTNGAVSLDLGIVPKLREMKKSSRTRFAESRNIEPAGYWGDYRSCDTPIWAFDEAIDRISSSHKNVDAIYYIGDTIDHGVWETTYELINDMNLHLVDKIRQSFGDDVLVIPVIGNHESQPTNQFAPPTVQDDGLNTTWLYEALVKKWGFYLTEEAKATLYERGEFAVTIRPGLKAISLNNNVAYKFNWWLVYDPLDAKRHLDWLVEELYKSELAGEKVHILTHIPPGVHDLTHTWTKEYNKIVNRFSSTIAAEFNGHTHSDEFKIFYSEADNSPINVAWGAGSLTSYVNYNLNYKIASFDTKTFEPINILNYVYNLTEANLRPNRRPHWFQLYNTKTRYQLSDLSAASMDKLVTRMVTDNTQLLDLYSAFFSKISDRRWPYCDNNCKIDNLCKTVVTVLWQRKKCEELRNIFYSRNK